MRRAVILAGGEGTRLRPYTTVLPKPLMPIGDRPVLDIVIRQLHRDGFEHITIATGYLAELIENFFRDGDAYGVRIDYFRETEPLGTVGALALIDGLADDFLVINGDTLTDMDYAALLERHRASDAAATIATTQRDVQISLGVLHFDDSDGEMPELTGYTEKPTIKYRASMGVYCFSPRAIGYIDRGERLDFPDLILRLIDAGETVRAWQSDDYWLDIGRHDDYEQAQEEFERMRDRLLPQD
ncbi:MAG TPA: sugar phosphate nucleotidyltransferase [Thermoleophilaceae bacterium]|nr:sugar phosphate nucleotidyltransferase [Thermoleophilaceae bacterium]